MMLKEVPTQGINTVEHITPDYQLNTTLQLLCSKQGEKLFCEGTGEIILVDPNMHQTDIHEAGFSGEDVLALLLTLIVLGYVGFGAIYGNYDLWRQKKMGEDYKPLIPWLHGPYFL